MIDYNIAHKAFLREQELIYMQLVGTAEDNSLKAKIKNKIKETEKARNFMRDTPSKIFATGQVIAYKEVLKMM